MGRGKLRCIKVAGSVGCARPKSGLEMRLVHMAAENLKIEIYATIKSIVWEQP